MIKSITDPTADRLRCRNTQIEELGIRIRTMHKMPKNAGALNRISNKQIQKLNRGIKDRKDYLKENHPGLEWKENNGSKCLIAECVQKACDINPRSDMYFTKINSKIIEKDIKHEPQIGAKQIMPIFEDEKAKYNVSCGCSLKIAHATAQKVAQPPTTRN